MGIITQADLDPAAPAAKPDAAVAATGATPATPEAAGAKPKYNVISEADLDDDHSGYLEAAVRGPLQGVTFGTADEIGGALNALFSPRNGNESAMDHYRRERDKIRAANDASHKAHPWLYGLGEIAGAIPATIATAGLGEAAGAVAEGAELAPEAIAAAKAFQAAHPLVSAIGTGAASGAAYGAASGFGTSKADVTKGDYANAAYDTLKGAGIGAATGGVLGGVGQKVSSFLKGGSPAQVESVYQGAIRKALPSDLPAMADMYALEGEAKPITDDAFSPNVGPTKSAKQVIADNMDVLKDLRSSEPEKVKLAAEAAKARSWSLDPDKQAAYNKLNAALDPETKIGPTNNDMVRAVEKMGLQHSAGSVERKVVDATVTNMKRDLSTIDSNEAKTLLLRGTEKELTDADQAHIAMLEGGKSQPGATPKMQANLQAQIDDLKFAKPDAKTIELANALKPNQQLTEKDIASLALHLTDPNVEKTLAKNAADIPDSIHDAIKEMPFEYSPKARRPLQEHREYLTDAQQAAADTMGTIDETVRHRLKEMVPDMMSQSLKRAMNNANTSGVPGVSKAVQTINDINRQQHVLLSLTGESPRLVQKLINAKDTMGSHLNRAAMEGIIAHSLATMNPAGVAVGYAGLKAPGVISSVGHMITDARADAGQYIAGRLARGRTFKDAVGDAIRAGIPAGAITAYLNSQRAALGQ